MPILQFHPFSSAVDATFWTALAGLKIDSMKLSSERVPITAFYSFTSSQKLPALCCLSSKSFGAGLELSQDIAMAGSLWNTNTIEDFSNIDKTALIAAEAAVIWDAIRTGTALSNPDILNSFIVISFADLKRYKFDCSMIAN